MEYKDKSDTIACLQIETENIKDQDVWSGSVGNLLDVEGIRNS